MSFGKPYIMKTSGYIHDGWFVLRLKDNIDIDFFYYLLISPLVQNQFNMLSSGAIVKNISSALVKKAILPIPQLPEQKRIVKILDEAFAAIDKAKANTDKNLQNSRELFDSYLNKVFANPGEDWEKVKLEDVSELISKGSSPKWQGIKYVEDPGILFVTSENVGKNSMLLTKRKYVEEKFNIKEMKSILKNGDVLTNIVGASIGRTAIFDLDDVANINQAVCLIRCNQNLLFNEYLMYILNSPFIKQHLHDNEVNNARANLSLGFFRNLSIPLPKIKKQKSIVSQIKSFHIETQKLESIYQQKIDDLEELKKQSCKKHLLGNYSVKTKNKSNIKKR